MIIWDQEVKAYRLIISMKEILENMPQQITRVPLLDFLCSVTRGPHELDCKIKNKIKG